jgi:prephenate dehydrogenase
VGSHPIAGSEQRGISYARGELYAGKLCILTPTPRTSPTALRRVEALWEQVGMYTTRLSPMRHDRALARVSHLPHLLASLLVDMQKTDELDLAGTGFIDSTRIAGGDPVMWRDICLENAGSIRRAIDSMGRHLAQFRSLLDAGDGDGLERLFARAQRRRRQMLQRRMEQGHMDG